MILLFIKLINWLMNIMEANYDNNYETLSVFTLMQKLA